VWTDRPESISGLSEWPYAVPFSYRLLMSGEPQLCASLVFTGFESEESDDLENRTRMYAISSVFAPGFERLERFFAIVRHLAQTTLIEPVVPMPSPQAGLFGWLRDRSRIQTISPSAQTIRPQVANLLQNLDESLTFLRAHRNQYLLLETVELDMMSATGKEDYRALVEAELARCQQAGVALDALPEDVDAAAARLQEATAQRLAEPLDAFYGLRLDDYCDHTRDGKTDYPLGLYWDEVLYFRLHNKAEFTAEASKTESKTNLKSAD
jgi:hypothetical protein